MTGADAWRWGGAVGSRLAVALVVAAVFIFPVVSFLSLAVSPHLLGQGAAWWTWANFQTAFSGYHLQGLINTAVVGGVGALLAASLALALAFLTERADLPGRTLWQGLIWLLLLTPTYLVADGWVFLTAPTGPVAALLGQVPTAFDQAVLGPLGVIWVLSVHGVPFAYLALSGALRTLGRDFEDVARVHGATRWQSLRVQVSLLAPALWSALAIVLAESISDFGVASTLAAQANFPVATYDVYESISTVPINFGAAAATSWALVAMVAAALLVQSRAMGRRSFAALAGRTRPAGRTPLSRLAGLGACLGAMGFFVLALGVPALGVVVSSLLQSSPSGTFALSTANYSQLLSTSSMLAPARLSFTLAVTCATLCVAVGGVAAQLMSSQRSGSRIWELALLATVGLPSVVVGIGFVFAYDLPQMAFVPIYGTIGMLILGYVAGFSPVVARLLLGNFAQVHRSLSESARVHGAGRVGAWRLGVLPLLAPSLERAWLYALAAIVFELPLSEVLHPPGVPPLSVAVNDLLRYDYGGAAALTVITVLATLALVFVALALYRILAPRSWQGIGALRGAQRAAPGAAAIGVPAAAAGTASHPERAL